jgi:hypothetical protein
MSLMVMPKIRLALDQALRVSVCRRSEDFSHETGFHNAAVIHHRNPVRDLGNQRQVMADQKKSEPVAFLHALKQTENLSLECGVHCACRLIGD